MRRRLRSKGRATLGHNLGNTRILEQLMGVKKMRKLSQSGISTAQLAIVLAVVIAAAGASAVALLELGGPAMNATATVMLHDAETIDLSEYEDSITPYLPAGASIDISGTFTVNLFSATNVAVKLHNRTADEWITIVEGHTVTDMTESNDFAADISSGTYDKVSLYVGTITLDVSWSEITINLANSLGAPEDSVTAPAGSYSGSVTLDQEFEIPLATEVVVAEGEHQVFDVDTGAPINPLTLYSLKAAEDSCSMDAANMSARGL